MLQKPDDARARPTTVADKHYKKLFSEDHPKEIYSKCALIMRRVGDFLDTKGLTRGDKLNVMFYLAMCATCTVLRLPAPKRPSIASVDIDRLDNALLAGC